MCGFKRTIFGMICFISRENYERFCFYYNLSAFDTTRALSCIVHFSGRKATAPQVRRCSYVYKRRSTDSLSNAQATLCSRPRPTKELYYEVLQERHPFETSEGLTHTYITKKRSFIITIWEKLKKPPFD